MAVLLAAALLGAALPASPASAYPAIRARPGRRPASPLARPGSSPDAPGTLTITAPAAATLPATSLGLTTSGHLGLVTVNDSRIGVTRSTWSVTVSATPFTSGVSVLPLAGVTYWSGPGISCSGTGTFIPGQPTAANAVSLATTQTAFTHQATSAGLNVCSWNPTLSVAVPLTAVVGTYRAVITHSVSVP